MRPFTSLRVGLLAGALLLSGCSGSEQADSGQVTEITEAPTTTVVDPYAVPAVIDKVYVDKVLAAHVKVRDDAVRGVMAAKSFGGDNESRIRSIYDGEALSFQLGVFNRAAAESAKVDDVDSTAVTTELRVTRSNCIWGEARATGAGGSNVFGFVLKPTPKTQFNSTGWIESQFTAPNLLTAANAC